MVTLISSTRSRANSEPFRPGPPSHWTTRGSSHTVPSARQRGEEVDGVVPRPHDVDRSGDRGGRRGDQEARARGEQRRVELDAGRCGDDADALTGLARRSVPFGPCGARADDDDIGDRAEAFEHRRVVRVPETVRRRRRRRSSRRSTRSCRVRPRVDPFVSRAAPRTPRRSKSEPEGPGRVDASVTDYGTLSRRWARRSCIGASRSSGTAARPATIGAWPPLTERHPHRLPDLPAVRGGVRPGDHRTNR